jgi:hypothetical protein
MDPMDAGDHLRSPPETVNEAPIELHFRARFKAPVHEFG